MTKPTWEEYKEFGRALKQLWSDAIKLHVELGQVFPKKALEGFDKTCKGIDAVRNQLDKRVFNDYPKENTDELAHVFYGD